MNKDTAAVIAANLIGYHAGEFCHKPNNPSSHSMFKAIFEARGGNVSHEILDIEAFADILIEYGQALKSKQAA